MPRTLRTTDKLLVCSSDLDNLRTSGLKDETIWANGLRTDQDALVFPYHDLDGKANCFARRRPHNGKPAKYIQPSDRRSAPTSQPPAGRSSAMAKARFTSPRGRRKRLPSPSLVWQQSESAASGAAARKAPAANTNSLTTWC